VKKTLLQLIAVALLAWNWNAPVTAQNSQPYAVSVPVAESPVASVSQTGVSSLSNLPEADTFIFINPRRILNEAAPRVLQAKELADMRNAFEQAKQATGVDPTKIDYIVLAVRFRKPSAELAFMPPELMAVAGGDFSADSLLALAKGALGEKLRDQSYGAKTLSLMTVDPIVKEAEKNPVLKSFTEIGVVPLNSSTIAVGTTAYLKAAVDAEAGNGRISPESLASLLRDPNALISFAGTPLASFSKTFGLLGTEANARAPRCDSRFGDFYAAVTMDATNFMLRGFMNADNPDTAKIMNNLISGLLRQASSSMQDATTQSVLRKLTITAHENEVVLNADIPHQMVVDFMKKMQTKKEASATTVESSTPPAKKPTRQRRPRRGSKP
jgi:hypothetical protein